MEVRMGKLNVKEFKPDTASRLDSVVGDLRKMTAHFKDDAGDALAQTAASLASAAVELAEEAKARGKAAARKAGDGVRQRPVTTLATIAAAAAAVAAVGIAMSRKKRESV